MTLAAYDYLKRLPTKQSSASPSKAAIGLRCNRHVRGYLLDIAGKMREVERYMESYYWLVFAKNKKVQ
jgi:hypothetical protein